MNLRSHIVPTLAILLMLAPVLVPAGASAAQRDTRAYGFAGAVSDCEDDRDHSCGAGEAREDASARGESDDCAGRSPHDGCAGDDCSGPECNGLCHCCTLTIFNSPALVPIVAPVATPVQFATLPDGTPRDAALAVDHPPC